MSLSKEEKDKLWEWIDNLPLDLYAFQELAIDLYLDDIFPHITIPEKNAIMKRIKND